MMLAYSTGAYTSTLLSDNAQATTPERLAQALTWIDGLDLSPSPAAMPRDLADALQYAFDDAAVTAVHLVCHVPGDDASMDPFTRSQICSVAWNSSHQLLIQKALARQKCVSTSAINMAESATTLFLKEVFLVCLPANPRLTLCSCRSRLAAAPTRLRATCLTSLRRAVL